MPSIGGNLGGGGTGGGSGSRITQTLRPPRPQRIGNTSIRGTGGGFGSPITQTLPKPPKPPQGVTPGQNASGVTQTQASPLDSTYFSNVAANQFKTNNSINSLNLANSNAGTALQAALAQLAYAQPRAQLALEQQANARGGLYSSVYDQNLGNLNYQYAGKQGGDINSYENTLAGNNAKIAALQGGIPLFNEQQAEAAATRAAQAAAKNPATGNGVLSTNAPAKTTIRSQRGGNTSINGTGGGSGSRITQTLRPPRPQRIGNTSIRGTGGGSGSRITQTLRKG